MGNMLTRIDMHSCRLLQAFLDRVQAWAHSAQNADHRNAACHALALSGMLRLVYQADIHASSDPPAELLALMLKAWHVEFLLLEDEDSAVR
jgi:hypothetical protein